MPSRDRIALYLAIACVAIAPLLIGSAPRWAALTSAGLAVAAAVPFVGSRRTLERIPLLPLLFVAAAAITLCQIVPLPFALADWLSPARAELAAANAAALGEPTPGAVALSYDPPATLIELAKLLGYAAFAYACIRLTGSRTARRWLLAAVALTACAVALIALLHQAAGATRLFGLYEPVHARARFLSPFINSNHLACFLAFATPLCLGLAVARPGAQRVLWLGGSALCAATSLLANSRAAALALVIGLLACGAMLAIQARHGRRTARGSRRNAAIALAAGAGLVAMFAVIAVQAGGDVGGEIAGFDSSGEVREGKLTAWRAAPELIADNPWTGVGRGAFQPAFTRVQPQLLVTFAYIENEYLQAVIDWGIPIALCFAIILGRLAIRAGRAWRRGPLSAGALAALIVLAVHNAFDFALQLPGVMLPAIAVATTLLPERLTRAQPSRRRELVRIAPLAAAAIAIALAATPLAASADSDARRVAVIAADPTRTADELVDATAAAMGDHPADYAIPAIAARGLLARRDPRATRFLNRALALNPSLPELHHLTGRMLLAANRPEQAVLEYRLAIETGRGYGPIARDLLARVDDPVLAARGLPTGERTRDPLLRLAGQLAPATALAFGERLAEAGTLDRASRLRLAELALAQKQPKVALTYVQAAMNGAETDEPALLMARVLLALDRHDEAVVLLDRVGARAAPERQLAVREQTAEILLQSGRPEEAKNALQGVMKLAGGDVKARARIHRLLAKIEKSLGNHHQSRWELDRARDLDPR